MRAKIEEYENYANLNLEIKEITRDPSQILQLDDNNWQQFILQNDMDAMGLNESDDGEDDGDECVWTIGDEAECIGIYEDGKIIEIEYDEE